VTRGLVLALLLAACSGPPEAAADDTPACLAREPDARPATGPDAAWAPARVVLVIDSSARTAGVLGDGATAHEAMLEALTALFVDEERATLLHFGALVYGSTVRATIYVASESEGAILGVVADTLPAGHPCLNCALDDVAALLEGSGDGPAAVILLLGSQPIDGAASLNYGARLERDGVTLHAVQLEQGEAEDELAASFLNNLCGAEHVCHATSAAAATACLDGAVRDILGGE
jgi:hypothetical protein